MRLSIVCQFVLLVAMLSGVYHVANNYQIVEKKYKHIKSDSEQERENIRVLQAEWAFLTNPVRMEKIAQEHFQLTSMNGSQLVALNNVPLRDAMEAQMPSSDAGVAVASSKPLQKSVDSSVVSASVSVAASRPPTALPAPLALPPITATPVSASGGGE